MRQLTDQLRASSDLSPSDIAAAAEMLLEEDRPVAEKAAFLEALHDKGESPAEIAAFVNAFLQRARIPNLSPADLPGPTIDVCGTGGDKLDLFNVSTTCIFVLAAGGLTVVKHGNRAITSKCGGADVLECLGVSINLEPGPFAECIVANGVGFLFAPLYHPAFKAVAPVRKALAEQGRKTIFNLLGPLLNPVRPDFQLVGVFDEALPPVYARILQRLGRREAWAVHGKTADGRGVDELSTMGRTFISRCRRGEEEPESWHLAPESLGLANPALEELQGGDAAANASALKSVLEGTRGPKRDMVLLNAAAAFALSGLVPNLETGLQRAAEIIDSGAAARKLESLRIWSAARS